MALAFQLNYKTLKFFDISQAGVYIISSYIFIKSLQLINSGSLSIDILFSIILTFLISSTISISMNIIVFKRFLNKKISSLTLLIIGLALYAIIANIISILFGSEIQTISTSLSGSIEIKSIELIISKTQIFQIIFLTFVLATAWHLIRHTLLGKQINAISDNEELLSILGHKNSIIINKVVFFSTILICCASISKSLDIGIEPNSTGFNMFITGVMAAIIGGIYSYRGAIIGGTSLGILNALSSWLFSGEWSKGIAFAVLIIILLIKRNGLFGKKLILSK